MLATRDVLAQPKDGYNLLLCTHFESINRAVYRNAQFELSDLAPISLISKYYYGLALANAVPATDLSGLHRLCQGASRRDQLRHHRLRIGAGDLRAPARTARRHRHEPRALSRRRARRCRTCCPGACSSSSRRCSRSSRTANDGKLKILGVSSTERLEAAPNVPTLREQGIDFVRFGWLGICAAAGTPPPIIDRLHNAHRDDRRLAGLPRGDRARRLDPRRVEPRRNCERSSCRPAPTSKRRSRSSGCSRSSDAENTPPRPPPYRLRNPLPCASIRAASPAPTGSRRA